MPRFFLEVQYQGTRYSGFQLQQNANTIQAEVQKAFQILQRKKIELTGSSRTDAGVHSRQNYFHFDFLEEIHPQFLYKINAILPYDIMVKKILPVTSNAHCRFDAVSREYKYYIYGVKDPFLKDVAYYYPYRLNIDKLNEAAAILMNYSDFTSFSKKNTQVKTFICRIIKSEWCLKNDFLVYNVTANRFLRGMVRGLTATMIKVGRNLLSLEDFERIIIAKNCGKASFDVPPHGLFLSAVNYPSDYFK